MQFYPCDSDLIVQLVLRGADGAPLLGAAKEDVAITLVLASGSTVTPTLVDGTLATYVANSWIEVGLGVYQFCPPNETLLPGTRNTIQLIYLGRYYYDQLDMVLQACCGSGSSSDSASCDGSTTPAEGAEPIELVAAANAPRSASGDGISVQQHSLPDLIAAQKYEAAKKMAKSKNSGVRFQKIKPPGTSGS